MKIFELYTPHTGLKTNLKYHEEGYLLGIEVVGFGDEVTGESVISKIAWLAKNVFETRYLFEKMEEYKDRGWQLTEINPEITFELFWETYAHKKDKKVSRDVWYKLKDIEKQKAFEAIERYDSELARDGIAKKHPKTYLRQKKWEDYE